MRGTRAAGEPLRDQRVVPGHDAGLAGGTPERIAAAFSVIDELTTERGLVTCETIPALRAGAGLDGDGPGAEARR